MKNLIKKIGQNKFQFFFFVGILVMLAAALIVSATLNKQTTPPSENPGVIVDPIPDTPDNPVDTKPEEVFQLPFNQTMSYKVVRKYYDKNASKEDQVLSLIKYGNSYRTSKGTGFAQTDNNTFEVLSVLSGKVVEIKESPLYGNYIVVEHSNGLKTAFYGLTEVTVSIDSTVNQGDKLGTSGYMNIDKEAGNHVFLEVTKDGNKLNVETLIGKKISEIN